MIREGPTLSGQGHLWADGSGLYKKASGANSENKPASSLCINRGLQVPVLLVSIPVALDDELLCISVNKIHPQIIFGLGVSSQH